MRIRLVKILAVVVLLLLVGVTGCLVRTGPGRSQKPVVVHGHGHGHGHGNNGHGHGHGH